MKILEHNVETGEVCERDATVDELKQFEANMKEFQLRQAEKAAKASAKAALLDRLGITEDEARLLLS